MVLADPKALAGDVLASLDGTPPAALRLLAEALMLTDGPLSRFGLPLDCYADHLEHEDVRDFLAVLLLARNLRMAALDPRCEAMLDRLEGVEVAPWAQIRSAVVAIRNVKKAA